MADTVRVPRFLLGTVAHNQHIGNIARALYEAGALGAFYTGGVDHFRTPSGQALRKLATRMYPGLEALMSRRRISDLPPQVTFPAWGWEGTRLAASWLRLGDRAVDWAWEHGELSLDRKCAEKIGSEDFGAFLGVEFGALKALRQAKKLGKPSIVAFLSPHHATRERWVDTEYARFPELLTPVTKQLLEKGKSRDARRDEEAHVADFVHCASRFTQNSLVEAGVPLDKMIPVPLGCPPVSERVRGDASGRNIVRFLYSGPVSVRKGAHILIEAWKKLRPGSAAELHFFGAVNLPQRCLKDSGNGVFFHGPISSAQMSREYRSASVLVFPTLCDGFGLVVGEAFAHGLPVITTPNAGAADLIRENQNGWLVTPGDTAALSARLEWCIDHPSALEELREPARETARQWTWAHFRSHFLEQLIDKLNLVSEPVNA